MGKASRAKLKSQNKQSQSYETNYIWNVLSIILTIILPVVAAMIADLRWLLFVALLFAIIPIRLIAKNFGHPHGGFLEVFLFFFVTISYATIGLYQWLEPTPQKSKPEFLIRIYPLSEELMPCKPPYKMYHLDVQNLNRNSVHVQDLRIQFHFKNIIAAENHEVLLSAGEISVGPVTVYKDCLTLVYKEQSFPGVSEKFSFQIQQAESDKKMNLNFADLYVDRWIEGASFSADIVIDMSKEPFHQKLPDEVNSYSGRYSYEIKGQSVSEQINGIIPEVGDKQTRKR